MTVMAGDVRINLLPAANYDNFGEDLSIQCTSSGPIIS